MELPSGLSETIRSLFSSRPDGGAAQGSAYVYDTRIMEAKIRELRGLLPKNVDIFYAMKANPHAAFLKAALAAESAGVEIASLGEGLKAIEAGFRADQLIFTGPGKSAEELEWCVREGIRAVHVESLTETHRLNQICAALDKRQAILVRVNPNFHLESARVRFSGSSSKMGVDVDLFWDMIPEIIAMDRLDFHGLHVYAGSDVLNADDLLKNCALVFDMAKKLEEQFPTVKCAVIDFGGGFGVDYKESGRTLAVEAYASGLRDLLAQYGFTDRTCVLELGRYLAADSGWYCTEIVDIKQSLGKKQVVCRGGSNHFRRPAALDINHPLAIVPMNRPKVFDRQESARDESVFIGGPLCTTADRLAGNDMHVAQADIGDIAVFCYAGAYGLSMSHVNFLSHPHPPEIVLGQ